MNKSAMAGLLSADQVDDLLYFSRTGDLEELKQAISNIDPATRRRNEQGDTASTTNPEAPGAEAADDLTDAIRYIHEVNDDKNTPLHYAAANGHSDIVAFLSARCRLQAFLAQNNAGNTALHWAAFNGHLAVVKHLVDRIETLAEQEKAAPVGTGINGDDPMTEERRAELTEEERDALDEREAKKRSVWDVVNKAGRGPTSEAQMNNQEAVVDFLLERIVAAPSSRSAEEKEATAADTLQHDDETPPDALPEGERPAAARQQAEQAEEAAERNASANGNDAALASDAAGLTLGRSGAI